ncbi:MAG: Cys-tRNA(Pro) deacylase [Bacteroidia bacterium]|nr:Cys-tRNA(Pro) deacylase [Bacteroidia bacterium]
MKKTNAARILDRLKIGYELLEYKVDESDLSAVHLAETAGVPIGQVFKTLVLEGDKNGNFVCIIPGGEEIDLKKAAFASSNKKVAMIKMKNIEPLTGYIRGGCSPLGMKKNFPVYIDKSAFNQSFIYISAGVRGMQIKLSPADLLMACKANKAEITQED